MLTLFILASILIIVLGGSSVIISGLQMGGVQSQSIRAYYAAEAGAERALYEFRKTGYFDTMAYVGQENVFGTTTLPNNSYYTVNYDSFNPIVVSSIGYYQNTRRSVELDF